MGPGDWAKLLPEQGSTALLLGLMMLVGMALLPSSDWRWRCPGMVLYLSSCLQRCSLRLCDSIFLLHCQRGVFAFLPFVMLWLVFVCNLLPVYFASSRWLCTFLVSDNPECKLTLEVVCFFPDLFSKYQVDYLLVEPCSEWVQLSDKLQTGFHFNSDEEC